ncbi:hypothetical protein NLI96_g10313 [Meripilus lineatus]|uniref:DUF6535 domain-containing protein n=1 Tax=Meripilus lineatus TaxID=2056292 RepID=A0AAD5UTW3_9APHY|nr:hypothetical protein NLI96_g10313 [Physisporinus lineatus]
MICFLIDVAEDSPRGPPLRSLQLNPSPPVRLPSPRSPFYHLPEALPFLMSAIITPPNPTSESTKSTEIALKSVPPESSKNPEARHSSAPNDQAKSPSINKIRGSQNSSRRPSIQRRERAIDVTFKGKTLTELKEEFEQKCAEIDKEHPELARKEGNRWNKLHEILKDRDAKAIINHNENIDTLLVFAGLYSAILTAFAVEAYKLLQRDSSEASLQVLVQISQQLGSYAISSGFANATYVPPSLPTFTPERSSVWLNGLWFVALILSLVTASLGMLVKQWLREYLNFPDVTPEAHRRIQLFRVRGLRKYKVSEIAALLPMLLQISLVLFFAGLVLFTRSVNATIGWIITGFVVAWGAFLVITTILPWFSASCPYKTPFLNTITLQVKRLLSYLHKRLDDFSQFRFRWLYRKLPAVLFGDDAETRASNDSSLDTDVLIDAYKTSGNANVWETVMDCAVDPQDLSTSLSRLPSVINRRCFPSETSKTLAWVVWLRLSEDERRLFVQNLAICIRLRLIQAFEKTEHSELDDNAVDSLLQLTKYSVFYRYSSSGLDRSLWRISSTLLQESLYVPFAPASLVEYASGLLDCDFSTLRIWEHFGDSGECDTVNLRSMRISRHRLAMLALIEASNEFFEQTGVSSEEGDYPTIDQCGRIIFCALRATEECRVLLGHQFPQLSCRIASKVKSLPNPAGLRSTNNVFEWHCVLDMAMRLHKRFPHVIDKTLFEALNTRSVKDFDLYVEFNNGGDFGKYIKGKPEEVPQTLDESAGPIDWDRILEGYAEVEVHDVGEYTEYGNEWNYQRLRVDCRHRMEFMLNYEDAFGAQIRRVMNTFRAGD